MNKGRAVLKDAPSAKPRKGPEPPRKQLVFELSEEVANLMLSDAAFELLRFFKKAIPIFYSFLK